MSLLKPLTSEEEVIILPTLIKFLKRNTNDSRSVTSEKIIDWFQRYRDRIGFKTTFNKQRLMKLVNHIRMHNLIALHSGPNGYCVTKDPVKIEQLIIEFKGRIDSHMAMVSALQQTKSDLELDIQVKAFDEVDEFKSFSDMFKCSH